MQTTCRIYSKLVFVVCVRASAKMRTHAHANEMSLQAHGIGTQIQIPESKVSKGVITQKIQHLGLHQPLKKIVGKSSES